MLVHNNQHEVVYWFGLR